MRLAGAHQIREGRDRWRGRREGEEGGGGGGREGEEGGGGGLSYVRIRKPAVVVHDLEARYISERREAKFKNVLAAPLKLVYMVQTLVELEIFFRSERPSQRQKHIGILKQKNATCDAEASVA